MVNGNEEKVVSEALIAELFTRFQRIEARDFAPFRVLRYRFILRKIRIALGKA